jgi:hypothetical protein
MMLNEIEQIKLKLKDIPYTNLRDMVSVGAILMV